MSDKELIEEAANLAYQYQKKYRGCSQCVVKALEDSLGTFNGLAFKATTALSGGVAYTGETCGALLGGIVAISLVFGRDKLEESWSSRGYTEANYYAGELCDKFKKELGSIKCRKILRARLSKSFDLRKPAALIQMINLGAVECCPEVVSMAARLAAEVILQARAST